MVHFARSGPAALSCSCARCAPRGARVTPFGCPRIAGYVLLPAAFRSLSRPSSPCSSTGIRHGPMLRLTILPSPRPRSRDGVSSSFLFPFPRNVKHPGATLKARPVLMGQNRVELLTPALSERCSNQLSYCPIFFVVLNNQRKERRKGRVPKGNRACSTPAHYCLSLRKEVIQPHLPVRLPCYDFTPLAGLAFGSGPPCGRARGFGRAPLGWCDGRCVQGPGTYSPRRADARLLAIPTSRRRVSDSDPD